MLGAAPAWSQHLHTFGGGLTERHAADDLGPLGIALSNGITTLADDFTILRGCVSGFFQRNLSGSGAAQSHDVSALANLPHQHPTAAAVRIDLQIKPIAIAVPTHVLVLALAIKSGLDQTLDRQRGEPFDLPCHCPKLPSL